MLSGAADADVYPVTTLVNKLIDAAIKTLEGLSFMMISEV